MELQLKNNLVQVIILDITGIYVQIHNQGYFDKVSVEEIKRQYSDEQRWRVVIVNNYKY